MRKLQFVTSSAGSAFSTRMLKEFEASGWSTQLISALTDAKRRNSAGRAATLTRRWRMYPGFAFDIIRACRRRDGVAVRIVTTNPFFAPWLAAKTASGQTVTLNLMFDVFPDALEAAGLIKPHGLASRAFAYITRSAFRNCDATIFLGSRLREYAESRYGAPLKSCVIPVGADGLLFNEHPPEFVAPKHPVHFLYCGNMGRMHDIDTLRRFLLSADAHKMNSRSKWVFHANGVAYDTFRKSDYSGITEELIFGGPLNDADWISVMRRSHVAVVTMKPGSEKVVMPSKTYSALVAGQAILAVCPIKSDLADLVTKHDCGWVIEPGDHSGLCNAVTELLDNREILFSKRNNAFQAGHTIYDMRHIAHQWEALFKDVVKAV